jgi:ppGpp synthetase/RelA/SpoT-type nucleotidyltranferase
MEQAFGADFSQVKVHTDSESDKLNKSIQAKAFTTGKDIFFKKGEYQPDSKPGQELLAHELTHVVQQNGNQVQAKSVKQVATKPNKLQTKLNLASTSIPALQRRENPQEQTDKENQSQPAQPTPAPSTSGDGQTPATPQPENKGESTATPEQSASGDKEATPVEGNEPTTGEHSPSEAVATEGTTATSEAGTPPATDKDTAPTAGGGSGAVSPASPETDPDFQAVVKKTKGVASKEKQHKPASAESKAAQDAAQPPGNEVESQAQANQVGEMEQAPTPGFNAAAFKAKLMERIAQTAPKTLEEADDFKNNNKLNSVKDEMQGSVEEEKAASQGDLEEKAQETPNTSGIKPKPVTPLPPAEMGETPNSIGAEKAVPKSKGNSEVEAPLQENSQKLDQQMAEADVTPEQLEKSNEPEFKTALSAKQDTQTHAQESPASYRQFEQEQLSQAEGEATTNAQEKLQGMHGERAGILGQVVSRQTDAKGKDEQARSKVAGELQKIYTQSKTKVESILSELDGKVNSTFDTGAAAAQKAFEDYVDEQMQAYKDERYSGLRGKGRWLKDKFLGLPDKVNVFYEKGRQIYLDKMNVVLDEIVSIIGTELTKAKAEVANGRQQVQDYVAKLPEDLKQVGQEAATNIQSQFDQLEETVDSKQEELIDSLAQKYNQKLQAVDAKIDEMKAANQGLVDKAANAITGVINTIKKLKDMLLNVLGKAASVIGSIIKDPIGFLGNLIGGIKQGFDGFVGNIMTHLQGGLIGWLTGALGPMGIQLPDDIFSLKGIFSLVMQVLGLTWTYIRNKAVKLFTEPIVAGMEKSVELFQVIRDVGPMGLWEQVKEQFGDLKETIIEQIKSMVITQVITAGVKWILGLLNPASAFVKAAMLIYDIVMFFVNQGSQVLALMNAVIDGIAAIAFGSVGAVAKAIENALARSLPVVIGFLASLLGIGGLAKKVQNIVKKIRSRIDKAIDKVLKKAKGLFKGEKGKGNKDKESKFTKKERDAGLAAFEKEEKRFIKNGAISQKDAREVANVVKRKHPVFKSITVVDGKDSWNYDYIFRAVDTPSKKAEGDDDAERTAAKKEVTAVLGTKFPDLANIINQLIDDKAHPLGLVRDIVEPKRRQRTLALIKQMAEKKAVGDQSFEEFLQKNPGSGILFEKVPDGVNFDEQGRSRKQTFVEEQKQLDSARIVGANPTEEEKKKVQEYAQRLLQEVEPRVRQEVEALANKIKQKLGGDVTVSVRTKTAAGLLDKVKRMVTGAKGRKVRADYQVGDVIDAVGARITVDNTEQLAALLQEIKEQHKEQILEIENMYTSPKSHAPAYRVIPMVLKTEVNGKLYTFELQLNTMRASIAADLEHNTVFKPLVEVTEEQKQMIKRIMEEAAALDQLETRKV